MLKRITRTLVIEGEEDVVDAALTRSQFTVVGQVKSIGGHAIPSNTSRQTLASMKVELNAGTGWVEESKS